MGARAYGRLRRVLRRIVLGARAGDQDRGAAVVVASGALVLFLLLGMLVVVVMFGGGSGGACESGGAGRNSEDADQPDAAGSAEDLNIPEDYLDAYQRIGAESGVPWNILAGVGEQESSHGEAENSPSITHGTNTKGAAGPMQIGIDISQDAGNSWSYPPHDYGSTKYPEDDFETFWDNPGARYDEPGMWYPIAADGDGDGYMDVYNKDDAIKGATGYLIYLDVQEDARHALQSYNSGPKPLTEGHVTYSYADSVIEHAERYADGDFEVVAKDGDDPEDSFGSSSDRVSCSEASTSSVSMGDLSVEPQDFEVSDLIHEPRGECAVAGSSVNPQSIRPLACEANKVIYDRFSEGISTVHGDRCPTDDGGRHPQGLAMDYMINGGGEMPSSEQRAHGDEIANWVMVNHEQLGVRYIIWYKKIWEVSRYGGPVEWENWKNYTRGSDVTTHHYDHVHVSFEGNTVSNPCG